MEFHWKERLFSFRGLAVLVMVVGMAGAAVGAAALTILRQPALTSSLRGLIVAQQAGCFGCHGPGGAGGGPNPGSVEGEVPPLRASGATMFYVQSEQEIREWILRGIPARLEHATSRQRGLIEMPAYEGRLSDEDVGHLIAYVQSVSQIEHPVDELPAEGRRIAMRLGCFNCHGNDGRGGLPNPGSFVGIIPPWDGDDYDELVQDDREVREWILDGVSQRFAANPAASFFLNRQAIQMPAYRDVISDGELDALVAFIEWQRKFDHVDGGPADSEIPAILRPIELGASLFQTHGCATCHGPEGRGGVPNPNAAGGYVPVLTDVADKLEIFEPEHVANLLERLQRGIGIEAMVDDPPMPDFDAFLDRYHEMQLALLHGGKATKRDAAGAEPPLRMPGWRGLVPDEGHITTAEIDSVFGYLLTLQDWDDDA